MPDARVLIADDQPDVLEALRLLLKGQGYQLHQARSPAEILAAVEVHDFDAILIDLNYARDTTSGREGLDLLARVAALDATLPVLVMTAWGSVDGAVEAIRRGARDYIQKPWDNERLLTTLRTQVELGRAERRSRRLAGENERLAGPRDQRFRLARPVALRHRRGPAVGGGGDRADRGQRADHPLRGRRRVQRRA